jgi:manganese efflux pump family protein
MEYLTSIFVGVGLAMDAFTVSLGIGTGQRANYRRAKFRIIYHFGLFQAGMTVVGWYAGSTISQYIRDFDHWIAFILLAYVGGNMIRSGVNPEAESYISDPSKGRMLIMLSVATSIDSRQWG